MILTGKTKEDFIKTKIGNEINLFESMLPIYKNALIIEWFDSVGIHICVTPIFPVEKYGYSFSVDLETEHAKFNSRQEATEQSIIKAN